MSSGLNNNTSAMNGLDYMNARYIKKIKDGLRLSVEALPYGIGIKIIKLYLRVIGRKKKSYGEIKEARRILKRLKLKEIKKILIVYDNLASPPTYGDFLCTVMLARYFTSQDIPVSFVIVDGEYRADWRDLDADKKVQRTLAYIELATLLLDQTLSKVEVLKWPELEQRLKAYSDNEIDIPFKQCVMIRSYIYGHAFNVLNILCEKSSQSHLNRFLLSINDFSQKVSFTRPEQAYITYHCRYSQKQTSLDRNTKDGEFLQVCARLKSLYPEYELMIVSDAVGYAYFKSLAEKNNVDCIFSKEYSNTFFGDSALILGGEFHFTLRGGGIDIISLFSQGPYEQYASLANDDAWSSVRANVWSSQSQIFTDIKWSPKLFLPTGHVRLVFPASRRLAS